MYIEGCGLFLKLYCDQRFINLVSYFIVWCIFNVQFNDAWYFLWAYKQIKNELSVWSLQPLQLHTWLYINVFRTSLSSGQRGWSLELLTKTYGTEPVTMSKLHSDSWTVIWYQYIKGTFFIESQMQFNLWQSCMQVLCGPNFNQAWQPVLCVWQESQAEKIQGWLGLTAGTGLCLASCITDMSIVGFLLGRLSLLGADYASDSLATQGRITRPLVLRTLPDFLVNNLPTTGSSQMSPVLRSQQKSINCSTYLYVTWAPCPAWIVVIKPALSPKSLWDQYL